MFSKALLGLVKFFSLIRLGKVRLGYVTLG